MSKSKPTGLRYDLELYYVATKEHDIKTPQQWLSYLEKSYIENRSSEFQLPKEYIKGFVSAFVSPAEEKTVAKTVEQPIKKETILISEKNIGKHIFWKEGDPKENTGAFYLKYGCSTYDQIKKAGN